MKTCIFLFNGYLEDIAYFRKVVSQSKCLIKKKINCTIFCRSKFSPAILQLNANSKKIYKKPFFLNKLFERINLYFYFIQKISSKSISYAYMRWPGADLILLLLLLFAKIKNKKIKIYAEVPTYPYDKIKGQLISLKQIISKQSDFVLREWTAKQIHAFTVIGKETDKIFGAKAIPINNGVDVSLYPKRNFKPKKFICDKILFVGSLMSYHGIDRLLPCIAECKEKYNKKIVLEIVGEETAESIALKNKASKMKISKNVYFYTERYNSDLNLFYNQAVISVSAIGWHRIGVTHTSNLKSREYAARGIPYLYSGIDTLAPESPYILQVSSDEQPIDTCKILKFIKKVKTNKTHTKELRGLAQKYLTWEKALFPLLQDMKEET